MKITDKEETKLMKQVVKLVIPNLINDLHAEGIIVDSDFEDKNILRDKLKKFIDSNKNIEFQMVVDHRATILGIADQEYKNGHVEFANSLYATFIEHTLNRIIHIHCHLKKINDKTKIEVIRNVNIIGKCTWLLNLLGLPPFNQNHIKTILNIAEERNAYLHYKWKPDGDFDKVPELEKSKIAEQEKNKRVKALIRYLKNYETKHEFGGKKNKILKAAF